MTATLRLAVPRRPAGRTIAIAALAVAADVLAVAAVTRGWLLPGLRGFQPGTLAAWVLAAALAVAGLTAVACRRDRAGWFHPLSLPLAVVAVMSLGAVAWAHLTRQGAGLLYEPGSVPAGAASLAAAVSARACAALVLVVGGYAAGALVSLAPARRPAIAVAAFRWGGMRRAGLRLMGAGAVAQMLVTWLGRGEAYGAGQLQYGLPSLLAAGSATALLAGLAVVLLPARDGAPGGLRGLLAGREWAVLGAWALAVAVSGQRGGLIAPAVVLAWAYSAHVRAVRLRWIAAVLALGLVAGASIAHHRSGAGLSLGSPASVMQGAAGDVSSPAWITQETVAAVLFPVPYLHGSTYLAALEGQVPGPLSRRLGAPSRTASAQFRDLIGFRNPDQGFAESLPGEAYLNFGLPGCLGAGVFLGALMGWAWRRRQDPASRARDVLYVILLAGLAYGFRSDALTQVKDVLYPMLAVSAVIAWYRVPSGRPAPGRAASGEVGHDEREAGLSRAAGS